MSVSKFNLPPKTGGRVTRATHGRKPGLQLCKFCGDWVNLDEEGNTYADGTAAHEACHDTSEFERQNASDFRD